MRGLYIRRILALLIALSGLSAAYCLVGALQAGMLSGAPSYSPIRAEYNEYLWSGLFGFFLVLVLSLCLIRKRIKQH